MAIADRRLGPADADSQPSRPSDTTAPSTTDVAARLAVRDRQPNHSAKGRLLTRVIRARKRTTVVSANRPDDESRYPARPTSRPEPGAEPANRGPFAAEGGMGPGCGCGMRPRDPVNRTTTLMDRVAALWRLISHEMTRELASHPDASSGDNAIVADRRDDDRCPRSSLRRAQSDPASVLEATSRQRVAQSGRRRRSSIDAPTRPENPVRPCRPTLANAAPARWRHGPERAFWDVCFSAPFNRRATSGAGVNFLKRRSAWIAVRCPVLAEPSSTRCRSNRCRRSSATSSPGQSPHTTTPPAA